MDRSRHSAPYLRVAVAALISLTAMACSTESGQPRPELTTSTSEVTDTTGQTTTPSATVVVASVDELDLCALLEPDDFPVDAAPGDEPLKLDDSDSCGWTISIDNAGGTFSAGVGARAVPFSRYVPPPGSPNGRYTDISSRATWLGNPLSDVEESCTAVFGAVDGVLTVSVTDETGREMDPCATVTQLAEIVISRTPPPTE